MNVFLLQQCCGNPSFPATAIVRLSFELVI